MLFPAFRRFIILFTILAALPLPGSAFEDHFDTPFPEEPERYDSEYYLDMLTMRVDREWRDLIDSRDNVFVLRTGSLNVEQWALFQSLKFSSDLSGRLRFRYWLDLDLTLDERSSRRNELELELRLGREYFVSLLFSPSPWKRDSDIGIGFQRRTAVDRYARLIFRVHDFANDFAYHHGDNIEGEMNLYSRQPVEMALEMRDEAGPSTRFGARGRIAGRWEKQYRSLDGREGYDESGYVRDLSIWLERELPWDLLLDLDVRLAEYHFERSASPGYGKTHEIREFLPRVWWRPDAGGLSLSAGLQVRRERWTGRGELEGSYRKDELLPFLLVRRILGGAGFIELGYLADLFESERTGLDPSISDRSENRLKVAWEIRFGAATRFRLVETLDLDREDWGDYSIHDHFFMMLLAGF